MQDVELPLTSHLEELRSRLSRALLAVAVAFVLCYPASGRIMQLLTAPLLEATNGGGTEVQLIGTGVAEAFYTRLKICVIAGIFLALPVILYQAWMFVVPGLRENEARYAKSFVAAGTLFFLAGAWFCYAVIFPVGFPFFLSEYADIGVTPAIRIGEYLSFTSRMVLAFGVTFEMPVATFFLARAGVVTHRTLIGYLRYAILVIFVAAAVLTPSPDAASQVLMAAPLLVLYGLSIGIAYFARRE
jgi:sec-independent protein translocase protein TatC